MLIRTQGNVNDTFDSPLQMDWNDIIFCNEGGKQNMSLAAKNIPPMVSGSIPSEIQIRNTLDSELYYKIRSFDSICYSNMGCTVETPLFRFQVIYDGYDFLYYPEFKLYERPYLVLERNYSIGTDSLTFSGLESSTHDNADNIPLINVGDILRFLDTGDSYTITQREIIGTDTVYIFNSPLSMEHLINDVLVVETKKYVEKSDSNIMDNTSTSCFKFKFVDPTSMNAKDYAVTIDAQLSTEFSTLTNDNFSDITDIWGDDKIVSLSHSMEIDAATIVMNNDIDTVDDEIEFNEEIVSLLEINSYFSLKNPTTVEIVRVVEILSNIRVRVMRAQLESIAGDFTAAGTTIYFPKNIYFWMMPVNNYIDFRYIIYRNIDFVLTWV